MKFVWAILVIVTAVIITSPGIQRFAQGAPIEEWIADVVLGVLLLMLYFGTRAAYWLERDQPPANTFQLSDWTILIVSGLWITASGSLIAIGLTSIGVVGFLLAGSAGFIVMLYRLYDSHGSPSANGV